MKESMDPGCSVVAATRKKGGNLIKKEEIGDAACNRQPNFVVALHRES
jgi:hypothetical protein